MRISLEINAHPNLTCRDYTEHAVSDSVVLLDKFAFLVF
jgi:hypothetical protein